jgi:hypothetical protein
MYDWGLPSATVRAYGPKFAGHPSVGMPCAVCHVPLAAGDWTTLMPLTPGFDPDEPAVPGLLSWRRPYNAWALEAHFACYAGREPNRDERGYIEGAEGTGSLGGIGQVLAVLVVLSAIVLGVWSSMNGWSFVP